MEECSQDEHVQRALENTGSLLCLLIYGRRPTLASKSIAGIRLSVVKADSIVFTSWCKGRLSIGS
jgi:hypothetical protein